MPWKSRPLAKRPDCRRTATPMSSRLHAQIKRPREGPRHYWQCEMSGSGLEGLHARIETAHLAGGHVGVDDALLRGPCDLGLGRLERGNGFVVLAAGDRLFDLADEGAHARPARLVDLGARRDLAG